MYSPEYRNMGLASVALSELSKRTKQLVAKHMTGGVNNLYSQLGYDIASYNEIWEKESRWRNHNAGKKFEFYQKAN